MSKSKGKGKGVAEPENPPSRMFTLHFSNLQADYATMMEEIEATIKEMNENEINKEPPLLRKPLAFREKMYTPKEGTFLVRLVPDGEGKVVTLLFRWVDLYFGGFHVEDVWYFFRDFDPKMLPPRSQLSYNPKDGVGKIRLIFHLRYSDVGGCAVKVGRPAFDRCIATLSKAGELHGTKEGQKILKGGPLALPMVAISEAIHFDPWRTSVKKRIGEEVDDVVEEEYSEDFLYWEDMSDGIVRNQPSGDLEVEELVRRVRILMRCKSIKPVKLKWACSSSSSSGKKKM